LPARTYPADMRVAIIDYQAGNLTSVQRALAHLSQDAEITSDPAVIAGADRVIFPGVGAAGSCMANLRARGLDAALRTVVAADKPLLCICVGMQLLFASSEEDGGVACLGLLPGEVRRFHPIDHAVKVPHMGWNPVSMIADPLSRDLPAASSFYFVHSYYCAPGPGVTWLASAEHGGRFCAGIRQGNLAAVQFHPEKSGPAGLKLLANFLA
jgi:glutamine amidotransferase